MTKNYNQLTSKDKENIVEYYYLNKKVNMNNIARNLNVSRRSISRVLQEKSVNTRLKNRYVLNENYFNEINTEAKAYILGFIYADGFVGNENFNNIVIAVNDLEILEFIVKEIEFTGEIRKTKKGGFTNSKCGYSLNFSSRIMADRLRNIGLYPNKSLTIDSIPIIREELVRHFIRTEQIKSLNICAKKEFDYIFNYLYLDSTIKLERKYNKWYEIKSAFAAGAVKQMR